MAKKVRTLSVGLLAKGEDSLASLEASLKKWEAHTVKISGNAIGTLRIRPPDARRPRWAELLDDADENPIGKSIRAFEGALLLMPVKGRNFVVAFGNGHLALCDELFEGRFGRLVTLNSLLPGRVRVADTVRLDGASRNARTQVARPASLSEFGIDVNLDLVRSIRGECAPGGVARRIGGSVMLQFSEEMDLAALNGKLDEFLTLFGSTGYKMHFGGLEQLEYVRDGALRRKLDDELVTLLNTDHVGRAWLAVPEVVDWSSFDSFRFSSVPERSGHLDDLFVTELLSAFRGTIGDAAELRKARVEMHRTDASKKTWNVYRCVYAEVEVGDQKYVLNAGFWYRIARDLVELVNDTMKGLAVPTLNSATWSAKDHEETFNGELVKANGGSVLGDQKLVHLASGLSGIEVCDVLGEAGELVHVKKYGASSVLSHLFAQGVNSAEALGDPKFRALANEKLGTTAFGEPWDPKAHPVVFLIGAVKPSPLHLPFFSKLTLHNAVHRLRLIGHPVQLGATPIT